MAIVTAWELRHPGPDRDAPPCPWGPRPGADWHPPGKEHTQAHVHTQRGVWGGLQPGRAVCEPHGLLRPSRPWPTAGPGREEAPLSRGAEQSALQLSSSPRSARGLRPVPSSPGLPWSLHPLRLSAALAASCPAPRSGAGLGHPAATRTWGVCPVDPRLSAKQGLSQDRSEGRDRAPHGPAPEIPPSGQGTECSPLTRSGDGGGWGHSRGQGRLPEEEVGRIRMNWGAMTQPPVAPFLQAAPS